MVELIAMMTLLMMQVAGIRSAAEGGGVLRELCRGRTDCQRVLSTGKSVNIHRCFSMISSKWNHLQQF